ncbi:LCP family protein [Bombilactobacillus folatiphilus]|uniref:LCP family protein n=1 Tax=Bombilactobacillus folatiphilus TaxID=2923362 RepID=A0ABY4P8K3_9LACO|nr:LCP family protein [Bombilactobacillus folatiphilus]UQS82039.1 LCP family protein [Bombilactobacillus folatiphilus]
MKNLDSNKPLLQRNQKVSMQTQHQMSSHRFLKVFALIMIMAFFVVGAYGFRIYSQASNALGHAYKPTSNLHPSKAIAQRKPVTILLLGVDTGGEGRDDRGNSDTMIVATINPKTKKTVLMSIPRDTLTQIYGVKNNKHIIQKINSAYNLGESEAAVKTVQKLVNIKVDNYITLDFHSLPKIVDAVGGVEVNAPFAFSYDGSSFHKGKQVINGKQSLSYARMRYEDPDGDYGRQMRQRQVITGIVKKATSLSTLPNLQKVLNSISNSMSTNLSLDDITALVQYYRGASKNIDSDHLQGMGTLIDNVSYEVAPTKELQRVSNKLRTSVGENKEELSNTETRQNYYNKTRNNFNFNSKANQNYVIYDTNLSDEYLIDK